MQCGAARLVPAMQLRSGLMRSVKCAGRLAGADTPAGNIARKYLQLAWAQLIDAGVPLCSQFSIKTVTHPVFTQGEHNLARASFQFSCTTNESKTLSSHVLVNQSSLQGFTFRLSNTQIDKSATVQFDISVSVISDAEPQVDDHQERLNALKKLLEQ